MLNHVDLIGTVISEPILRTDRNNNPVSTFRIACRRNRKNAKGEYETDFMDVVVWQNNAEFVCEKFKVGDPIVFSGHLQSKERELVEGKKFHTLEVICDTIDYQDSLALKDGLSVRSERKRSAESKDEA